MERDLINAVYNNNMETVKSILEDEKNDVENLLKCATAFGETPLYIACMRKNLDMVKFLFNCCTKVKNKDVINMGPKTPLRITLENCYSNKSKEILDFLVKNGACFTRNDLQYAWDCCDDETMTILTCGCMELYENRPIHTAAIKGNLEEMYDLINDGQDINEENICGWNALICALEYGQFHLIEKLLEHGAKFNVPEYYTMRSYVDNSEIIELLLKNGANVDQKDEDDDTLLDHCIVADDIPMIQLLMKYGAKMQKIGRLNIDFRDQNLDATNVINMLKLLRQNEFDEFKYSKDIMKCAIRYAEINDKCIELIGELIKFGVRYDPCVLLRHCRNRETRRRIRAKIEDIRG